MASETLRTPVGEVKFPKLDTPDENGNRTIAIVFSNPKEAEEFLASVDKIVAESAYPKTKPLYKADKSKNAETGEFEDNGKIIMNFKSKFEVPLFDAKKNKLTDVSVGWGSKVRVAFTIAEIPQFKCLTKYIKGIQVLELKGGTSAESCGFTDEEGYTAPENEETPWED